MEHATLFRSPALIPFNDSRMCRKAEAMTAFSPVLARSPWIVLRMMSR